MQTTGPEGETNIERKEVVIGLRDSQLTQIIDGVDEGDVLLVNYSIPVRQPGDGGGGPGN